MGGMSSISSMIGKMGNTDSDHLWSAFLFLFLSFFLFFFLFFKKAKIKFNTLHYRLVIYAYCKMEVKIVFRLQAQ